MELKDKVVVITGSAGGIGKEIALQVARHGAKVVVADRRDQPFAALPGTIDETVEEITQDGGEAVSVRVDLRHEDQIVNLRDEVLRQFGTVDVVINNAGIQFTAPIWEIPTERWDQVMGVNARGTFLMCKHFLPTLVEKRSGNVLNISSPAGRGPSTQMAVYGASKAAIDQFTLSLAEEGRPFNIAANCLAPSSSVASAGSMTLFNPSEEMVKSWEPVEHFAKAAVWLIQQDPTTFTGQLVYSRQIILEQDLCQEWCCATLRGPARGVQVRA